MTWVEPDIRTRPEDHIPPQDPSLPAVPTVRSSIAVRDLSDAERADALTYSTSCVEAVVPGATAKHRLSPLQRGLGMVLVVAGCVGLYLDWHATISVMLVVLTTLYLATLVHRVVVFRSSLRHDPMIKVGDDDALAAADSTLPTYTVLIPAFREPEVMAPLIASLERLDYPRHLLELVLLLESEDDVTLDAARAVPTELNIDVLVVPPGAPQTKPRALNYGLRVTTGELVTVYDAEDRPEPLQLRRAAVAMGRLGDDWACLQARLNFYRSDRNLLSKLFAAEYLTWFACFLPGIVNQGGVVPLGGTSNHFRRSALIESGAWDAFNVTEDADLGIRLMRRGQRIGVLDSVTEEEPTVHVGNWIRQRSRWQKGYLQTALVHSRRPRELKNELGWKGLMHLVLFIAGTPLLAVANLVFWATTALWCVAGFEVVRSFFTGPLFYAATTCWLLGNATVMYLGVVALLHTRRSDLVWAALAIPVYWVLMSVASVRAMTQLVTKPSHWEKTQHGWSGGDPLGDDAGTTDRELVIDLRDSNDRPVHAGVGA